ncbi:hypothetical protein C8R46DRAFT_1301308 [Mycena filopes]|nr:hypothetical protein C8R46DRAFT_1301308 [Mycena filopes]
MVFHIDLPELRDLHYSTEIPFTSSAPPSTSNRPPAPPPHPISLFTSNETESQSLPLLEVLKLQIVNVPSTLFTGLAAFQFLRELHVVNHRKRRIGLRPVFDDLDPSVCPTLHAVTFLGLDGNYFEGEEEAAEGKSDEERKEEKLARLQSLAAFIQRSTGMLLKRLHLQFQQTVTTSPDEIIGLIGGSVALQVTVEREGSGDKTMLHCSDKEGALAVELEYCILRGEEESVETEEEERPPIYPDSE